MPRNTKMVLSVSKKEDEKVLPCEKRTLNELFEATMAHDMPE